MTQSSLARKLRILRAERAWPLRKAAAEIGITKETLSGLERGRQYPHDLTLSKIASGYGVPLEELIVEKEPDPLAETPSRSVPEETSTEAGPSREKLHAAVSRVLHEHGVYDEQFEEQLADLFRRHIRSSEERTHAILRQKAKRDNDQTIRRNVRAYLHRQARELAQDPPETREPVDAVLEQAQAFMEPLDPPAENDVAARLEADVIEKCMERLEHMAARVEAGNLAEAKRFAEEAEFVAA